MSKEKKSQRASENEETPEAERQDLTTTIHSTSSDGAKVTISKDNAKSNLYRLAGQFVGVKSTKGLLAALSKALGLPDGEHKQSFYFEFADKAGNEYMLRISNHNVNVENSDGRVPEISIVIKSKRQPNRFHASDAQVQEYVYFKEDIAKGDGQTLTLIAQDIAAMLDSGKYDETSKLAVVNVSPKPEAPTTQAAVEVASAEVNTEPTQAQIEAGNYKKGHVQVSGFDITIENPAGSVRKGVDAGGKQWQTTMHNTYGYFKGTEGVDGDHIDVFLHTNMDEWDGKKELAREELERRAAENISPEEQQTIDAFLNGDVRTFAHKRNPYEEEERSGRRPIVFQDSAIGVTYGRPIEFKKGSTDELNYNSKRAKESRLTIMELIDASKTADELMEGLRGKMLHLDTPDMSDIFKEYVARYKAGLISKAEMAYAIGFTKEEAEQRYGKMQTPEDEEAEKAEKAKTRNSLSLQKQSADRDGAKGTETAGRDYDDRQGASRISRLCQRACPTCRRR
jgi:hypothetical protein